MLSKVLISVGSGITIGFGIWHFFVPKIWKWYSYIEPSATELIVAVRAINVFFSLSLILIGSANLIFCFGKNANQFSLLVILMLTIILWTTRSIFQIIYPQGSMNPFLQYAMLITFVVVTGLYIGSFILILSSY